MTGYESKRAAARDKLLDDDDTQVYQDDALTIAYQSGFYDGKKAAQRPWVGLEGEEIRYLWEEATKPDRSTMTMVTSFAKDIEAKLKEKNT